MNPISAKSAYLLFLHTSQLQLVPITQSFKGGKVIQARQAALGRSQEHVTEVTYTMGWYSLQQAPQSGPLTIQSRDCAKSLSFSPGCITPFPLHRVA